MSVTPPEQQPDNPSGTEQDAPDAPQDGQQPDDGQQDGEDSQEPSGGEEVPAEVLRAKLTEANAEAANYRTKLREAQEALANAKTADEFEAARTEFENKIVELERDRDQRDVAEEVGIPAALRHLIVGSDREAMKAQAEAIKPFLRTEEPPKKEKVPETPPRGGLDPSQDGPVELDPAVLRKQVRRRR